MFKGRRKKKCKNEEEEEEVGEITRRGVRRTRGRGGEKIKQVGSPL